MTDLTFTTRDLDEAVDFLHRTYADAEPMMAPRGSPERFEMSNHFHLVGPLTSVSAAFSTGLSWQVDGLSKLMIVKSSAGRLEHEHAGRTTRITDGMPFLAAEPHQPFGLWWDGPLDFELFTIEASQFSDLVDRYVPTRTGLPRFTGTTPSSPALARYAAGIMDLVKARTTLGAAAENDLVNDSLTRLVATAVLATFPHSVTEPTRDHGELAPLPVRRAVDFIEAHAGEPIGLAEIAHSAGFGPRALQLAFRRHLDLTPTQYLRRVRLDRAHQDLLRGSRAAGDSVLDIATRWGFTHPGRFAADYRATYHRPPRETLDRTP